MLVPHLGAGQGEITSVGAQWGAGLPDTHPRRGTRDGRDCRCHTALPPHETASREEERSKTTFGPADPAQGSTGDIIKLGERKG